jgi:ABC-type transporter lipoprotein component MlaA/pimeloyl-ACP methyl ester carboxylesterase
MRHPTLAIICCILVACSPTGAHRDGVAGPATSGKGTARSGEALIPESMADPFEPLNRGLWELNCGLLAGVMQPTGRVYRTVVPPPARRSIRDFTRNVMYPGRCVNHVLQGRWAGAGNESLRFLCNTTVGIGGLFDVASHWNLPKSEADFAQTFGHWGWTPQTYVMLPVLGPSDESHALACAADQAAAPSSYIKPLRLATYGTAYNQRADRTEEEIRLIRSQADSYSTVKYIWTYTSLYKPPDWRSMGSKDLSTLQTLNVARISYQNQDFPQLGREMCVRLPSTGRFIQFNCWLQPGRAPLVYVAPGLGSHRLSLSALSVVEHLYQKGFSVVSTTSLFHPEFMEQASTAALPAYPPVDCQDLLVALTAIDRALEKKRPGLLGDRALVGLSLGGFEALYLAARENQQDAGLLRFERYVAINTPVRLDHGVTCIDRFYEGTQAWPTDQRQFLANNALHKVSTMRDLSAASTSDLPFDRIESKFLIGLTFRLVLRDAIFSSQSRHNLGVLSAPLSRWRREPCYQEIMGYSYRDYFLKFVVPYYQQRGIGPRDFSREGNLMTYENQLGSQRKVRVITNRNDFLLTPADNAWLQSTLGPARLKVFPEGGHLGNLASAPVQKAITESLRGLK